MVINFLPVWSLLFLLLLMPTLVVSQKDGTCTCKDENVGNPIVPNEIIIERCDRNNATYCNLYCGEPVAHGGRSSYLSDKCCVHAGKSASLLAFEEDEKWVPRLEEFNKCTGAKVRLEYLAEGEDGMAEALRRDVGEDGSHGESNTGESSLSGEGIFDAYIVQAPW